MNLAIFGGTFDPIHRAHLEVARAARDAFRLQRVLVVPAAVPPHKRGRNTEAWGHRFRMVELACHEEPALEPSPVESGTEQSYSVTTIEGVRAGLRSEDRLFFVIGADAFAEITTWYRWNDVLRLVEFIVVTRPGHEYALPAGARVHPLASVHLPVSSSLIRKKLARCEAPEELPPAVFDYIREHRLYGFGSACGHI